MLSLIRTILVIGLVVTILFCLFGAFVIQVPPGAGVTVALGGGTAIVMASVLVFVVLACVLVATRRSTGWAKSLTGPNGRWLFFILLLGWVGMMLGMPIFAQAVEPGLNGAPSPAEGGLALLGMLLGVFLFMGFVWSVISE